MAIRDLTAKIRFTVDGTAVRSSLNQVDKSIVDLESAFVALGRKGDQSVDKLTDSVKKLDNEVDKTADSAKRLETQSKRSFSSLKTAALSALAAIATATIAARKAVELFQDAIRRAGQERSLEIQLQRSGIELEKFVKQLDDAARGALSRADSIASATRAIALGVDTEAIPRLLEVARNSAISTGQTVTQAFEDIALGVARQSRLILDNLGIIVDVEKANERYADALGVTAASLDDTQRRQAFLNAVLRTGEESFSDISEAASQAGIAFDRLGANVTDLLNSLTGAVSESEGLALAFDTFSAALGDQQALESLVDKAGELEIVFFALNATVPGFGDLLRGLIGDTKEAASATDDLASKSEGYAKAVEEMNRVIEANVEVTDQAAAANKRLTDSLEVLGVETDDQINKQIEEQRQIIATADALVQAGDITEGTYARAVARASDEIGRLNDKIRSGYVPALQEQIEATLEATQAGTVYAEGLDKQNAKTKQASTDTLVLTNSIRGLTQAQLDAAAAGEIINGTVGQGGTRVSFGTVRDAQGNIVQSAGSRLVRSDRNGGFRLRSGGSFRTVGGGIPADFSSFGGLGQP